MRGFNHYLNTVSFSHLDILISFLLTLLADLSSWLLILRRRPLVHCSSHRRLSIVFCVVVVHAWSLVRGSRRLALAPEVEETEREDASDQDDECDQCSNQETSARGVRFVLIVFAVLAAVVVVTSAHVLVRAVDAFTVNAPVIHALVDVILAAVAMVARIAGALVGANQILALSVDAFVLCVAFVDIRCTVVACPPLGAQTGVATHMILTADARSTRIRFALVDFF